MPFRNDLPKRSADVMVLGYPFADVIGAGLKTVRGPVFGFIDKQQNTVSYQAPTNPGNSGGPVCDSTGSVVAVHFAGADLSKIPGGTGKIGLGVAMSAAFPFFVDKIPGLTASQPGPEISWPEVDERVSKSTVMIKLMRSSVPMGSVSAENGAPIFEDRTCSGCRGCRKVPCIVPGCFKGSRTDFEAQYMVIGSGRSAIIATDLKARKSRCRGCDGSGAADCPFCRDGMDPALGGRR